jgi:hypothetical protein
MRTVLPDQVGAEPSLRVDQRLEECQVVLVDCRDGGPVGLSAVRLGGVRVSGVLVGVHAGQQRGPQNRVEGADRRPDWVCAGSGRVVHRCALLSRSESLGTGVRTFSRSTKL